MVKVCSSKVALKETIQQPRDWFAGRNLLAAVSGILDAKRTLGNAALPGATVPQNTIHRLVRAVSAARWCEPGL